MKLLSAILTSRDEFNRAINKVLEHKEYSHLKNSILNFVDSIKESIKKVLYDTINRVFKNISDGDKVSDSVSTIFVIIGFLIIVVIIIYIGIKICNVFNKDTRIKEILGEKIDNKTTPKTLRDKAAILVNTHDFREAIRYDFIALLLLLHEKNIVYLEESKTNEEIYDYLHKNDFFMLSEFKSLVNTFNSAWYGNKLCSKEVYEKWNQELDALWNEVVNSEI